MSKRQRKQKQIHWEVDGIVHLKPQSQECSRCHKYRIKGCHIKPDSPKWLCNACLKIRAANINQLQKVPGFLEGLPKLGGETSPLG